MLSHLVVLTLSFFFFVFFFSHDSNSRVEHYLQLVESAEVKSWMWKKHIDEVLTMIYTQIVDFRNS